MNRQNAYEMLKEAFQAPGLNCNSRHTVCGQVLRSASMKKAATAIWCRSYSVTETSPRRRAIWESTTHHQVRHVSRSCCDLNVTEDLLSPSFWFLGAELKGTADETLFLEITLRGYDLSKLREEEATAEIVKIG